MAPEQFSVMSDKAGPRFTYPFFASNLLSAGTILCIDVSGLVFAYDSMAPVGFELGDQTALHEEDTTPLALNTGGVTASPIRSLWQVNASALKLRFPISWGVQSGFVTYISGCNW